MPKSCARRNGPCHPVHILQDGILLLIGQTDDCFLHSKVGNSFRSRHLSFVFEEKDKTLVERLDWLCVCLVGAVGQFVPDRACCAFVLDILEQKMCLMRWEYSSRSVECSESMTVDS